MNSGIVWRSGRQQFARYQNKNIIKKALKSPLIDVEKKVTSHSVGQLYNGAAPATRIYHNTAEFLVFFVFNYDFFFIKTPNAVR